jgi:hypothetical protein
MDKNFMHELSKSVQPAKVKAGGKTYLVVTKAHAAAELATGEAGNLAADGGAGLEEKLLEMVEFGCTGWARTDPADLAETYYDVCVDDDEVDAVIILDAVACHEAPPAKGEEPE